MQRPQWHKMVPLRESYMGQKVKKLWIYENKPVCDDYFYPNLNSWWTGPYAQMNGNTKD